MWHKLCRFCFRCRLVVGGLKITTSCGRIFKRLIIKKIPAFDVSEIVIGKALCLGVCRDKVRAQLFQKSATPLSRLLALDNFMAEFPVETEEMGVD